MYVSAGTRLTLKVQAGVAIELDGRGAFASHATAARASERGAGRSAGRSTSSVADGKPRSERRGIRARRAIALPDVRMSAGSTRSAPRRRS